MIYLVVTMRTVQTEQIPSREQMPMPHFLHGEFQEWQAGAQFLMPLGFRRELATVRHHQLQLAKTRAQLQDEELEVSHALVEAIRNIDTNFALAQTNFNRRVAAERQVEAVQAAYDAGTTTFDQLLDAQRRRAQAESAYFRSLVDYNQIHCTVPFP